MMKILALFFVVVLSICIPACSETGEKDLANLQNPNDVIKREAIKEIANQKQPLINFTGGLFNRNSENTTVAILMKLLSSGREPEDIELNILKALGELGKRTEVPVSPLIDKLEDENLRIRLQAVESLGKIRNREAVPGLLRLLKAETSENRYLIIWALGEIGDEMAIPVLNLLLTSEDEYLRYNARKALRKIQ